MSKHWQISRRTLLRGIGTTMALPMLEAMAPSLARAARAAQAGKSPPLNRMVFIFVPNGKVMEDWTPAKDGPDYDLPPTLEALGDVRSEFSVLTGLGHANALALGDGPGDHARAAASYLTGAHPYKTGGRDICAGVSVDQFAAQHLGRVTRLASLEIGCDKTRNTGDCDSGYSCAYSHNISWYTEHMPMAKETNPRLLFERLFPASAGTSSEEAARRARYRKSVLDLVSEDAARLRGKLGAADRRKLDEYFSSIREIERRIERLVYVADQDSEEPLPEFDKPAGIPREYQEHVRITYDLLALALQMDLTRISTFMVGDESTNRSYRFIDVPDGHHYLSHHGGDQAKIDALRKINRWHIGEFARFIRKLKSMPEGEGSVLDNSMIVYGSGLADGNRHAHFNLPTLLAGHGGGTLAPGRHIRYPDKTPMANLFVALLERLNLKVKSFGDSTGPLPGLGELA